jgi:hypothetical protein
MGGGGGEMWTGGIAVHRLEWKEDYERRGREEAYQTQRDALTNEQLKRIITGTEQVYVVADTDEVGHVSAEIIVLHNGLIQAVTQDEALDLLVERRIAEKEAQDAIDVTNDLL